MNLCSCGCSQSANQCSDRVSSSQYVSNKPHFPMQNPYGSHYVGFQQGSQVQKSPNPPNQEKQSNPTIRPYKLFKAKSDAQQLRNAMKGRRCDKAKVRALVCARSNSQRQQMLETYKVLFGRYLMKDLENEFHGEHHAMERYENLILAFMESSAKYDTLQMFNAMKECNYQVLIEILCSRTNAQIKQLKAAYSEFYGRNLENDIVDVTSDGGPFQRILVSLCTAARDESMITDPEQASKDARTLNSAANEKEQLDTDTEECFDVIMANQNYAQQRLVFQEYLRTTSHTIQKAIDKEFRGEIRDALQAIVACVEKKPAYFAKRLYESIKEIKELEEHNELIRVSLRSRPCRYSSRVSTDLQKEP